MRLHLPLSGLCQIWCVKQAHKSLNLQLRFLALLFPYYELISTHIEQHYYHIRITRIGLCQSHIASLYNNSHIGLLHSRTRDRLNTFPCHRRVPHQFGAKHLQRYEVASQPRSTYCGLWTRNTYPHHCGP